MSRKSTRDEYRHSQILIAVVYLLLVGFLGAAASAAESEARTSTSTQHATGGRDGQPTGESNDVFGPLVTEGTRQRSSGTVAGGVKGDSSVAGVNSADYDFWFYTADVILFGDDDGDGHYHGIDLLFDADTIWSAADVYAVLYLSYEGGPWNEYAVTDDFRINGSSADDDYVVVTELESGYFTGSYDILIELFDARTGDYLAGLGPEENPDLGFLPLEDYNRDAPVVVDRPVAVSRGRGGGGAAGLGLFGLAAAGLLLARARRRF